MKYRRKRRLLLPIDPNEIKIFSDFLPSSTKELLFNPSADALGQAVGGIMYFLFQKPIKLGIIKRNEFADLANRSTIELNKIPKEQRTDEKAGLMMKTLENAQYSLDVAQLRQYFANLLANTANKGTNYQVSPLFPTILGNMSPLDAKFIALFADTQSLPIANISLRPSQELVAKKPSVGNLTGIFKSGLVISHPHQNATRIDKFDSQINFFESFGILNVTYGSYKPEHEKDFESIYTFNDFKQIDRALKNIPIEKRDYDHAFLEKGKIELTKLGSMFVKSILL